MLMSRRRMLETGFASCSVLAPAVPPAQAAGFGVPIAQAAGFGVPPAQAAGFGVPPAQAAGLGSERLREAVRPLPAIAFYDRDGGEVTLSHFLGQGLVLNLWATWCPPCVAEMPALDRLAQSLGGERIAVLPLSSDRGGAVVVEAFYRRVGLTSLGIWLDPRGAAARMLGARALPTTIIIDRAGQERARLEGEAAWDQPVFIAAIRRIVGP